MTGRGARARSAQTVREIPAGVMKRRIGVSAKASPACAGGHGDLYCSSHEADPIRRKARPDRRLPELQRPRSADRSAFGGRRAQDRHKIPKEFSRASSSAIARRKSISRRGRARRVARISSKRRAVSAKQKKILESGRPETGVNDRPRRLFQPRA